MKGRVRSKQHCENISKALKGKNIPLEVRAKISKTLMGHPATRGTTGMRLSKETRLKMSIIRFGKPKTKGRTGMPHTLETRRKISEIHKKNREKNHFWRGGITNLNRTIRGSIEYKLWREAVFKRDNWTCVFCLKRGERLEADHIKPFSKYVELRFDVSNGRTLCVPCHKTTDTYGNKKKI